MSASALAPTVESTDLLEHAHQLKSCILRLENARCAHGVLSPDNAELLEKCIREYAAMKRQWE